MWAGEEFYQMKLRLQRDGRSFDLNGLKQLGSGGEAVVYSLNGTPWAAKVYSKLVSGRDEKLRVMLANPPKNPTLAQGHVSIAWPQDLLIDQQGRIVGYVMPQVEKMRRMFDFYNPGTRRKICPLFTYRYLVATAFNLAIAVRALHKRGYVMGDVNESNFLVADNTMVTLVDTDSFQVREPDNGKIHHCTVASPLFTPREMQGVDFTMAVRREEHDLFGFGVLLFQLLMEGSHPFQARFTGAGDSPEPIEMIRLGNFPHGTGSAMWQPPPMAPAFGMLDPRLRSLFTRCFVNGHRDSKARPTADEWCANLKKSLGTLIYCKVNPSHLHWPHISRCPWCERKKMLRGRDPFPHPGQLDSVVPIQPSHPQVPAQKAKPALSWWKRFFGTPAASSIYPNSPTAQGQPSAPTNTSMAARGPIAATTKTPISIRGANASPSALPKTGLIPAAVAGSSSTAAVSQCPPCLPPKAQVGARIAVDIGGGAKLLLCGIPAGTFTMGGAETEETIHDVTLTEDFWLGHTPVTQGLWNEVWGIRQGGSVDANLPKCDVSWDDAMRFCHELNRKKLPPPGWEFTLPSEAQWEYACRAGTTGDYAGVIDEMAWHLNNSGSLHAVATKKPNAWGLYDMHGSVWEWCADWYGSYPTGAMTDPTGPSGGTRRVFRGGSWGSDRTVCRSARRYWFLPNGRSYEFVGLRVALVQAS
jgi:serine/threonine protein kinase